MTRHTFVFTILFLIFTLMPPVAAEFQFDPAMTADELWKRVDKSLAGLEDYTSNFTIDASSRDIHLNVKGKLYCILPDKLKIVFEGLPDFLAAHNEIIADHSIQDIIERENFTHTIGMTEILNGEPYYVINSSAKDKTKNLQEARFWIHAVNYTSNKVILKYANGGYVKAIQDFKDVEGYRIPSHQDINISFPDWRVNFLIDFYDFELNTGVVI